MQSVLHTDAKSAPCCAMHRHIAIWQCLARVGPHCTHTSRKASLTLVKLTQRCYKLAAAHPPCAWPRSLNLAHKCSALQLHNHKFNSQFQKSS
jgi:hypothetical protein